MTPRLGREGAFCCLLLSEADDTAQVGQVELVQAFGSVSLLCAAFLAVFFGALYLIVRSDGQLGFHPASASTAVSSDAVEP